VGKQVVGAVVDTVQAVVETRKEAANAVVDTVGAGIGVAREFAGNVMDAAPAAMSQFGMGLMSPIMPMPFPGLGNGAMDVVNTVGQFVTQTITGYLENAIPGGPLFRGWPRPVTMAECVGRTFGRCLAVIGGCVEFAAGFACFGLGIGLDITIFGAVVGVPANVLGAAMMAHGAVTVAQGVIVMAVDAPIPMPPVPPAGGGNAPRRVTNPKHNANSNSPEPANVQELFDRSIVDQNGVRWAKDADGTIHRFSRPSNGESHWNGSTAGNKPIRMNNIPIEIRRALQ
jgi:hypothetical protein